MSLELVACPDCGATAEVEWRSTATSTAGGVVLVKIRCLNRHWFLMPADGLVTASSEYVRGVGHAARTP